MSQDKELSDAYAELVAGGKLAEILALALIDKGLIDKDEVCAELELLADERRNSDTGDPLVGRLIQLANSVRASGGSKSRSS